MSGTLKDSAILLANLSALIDSLQSAVLVESESQHIVHVNQRFCDTFGIATAPAQLIGTDCSLAAQQSAHLFADPDAFIAQVPRLLSERQPVLNEEVAFADGRTFERDYVPVFNEGTFLGHLWNYRDVTQRRQLERHLQEQLIHADRLASVGQLAAGVAHEINNPAAYVLMNLSMIAQRTEDLAVALEGVRALHRSGQYEQIPKLLDAHETDRQLKEVERMVQDNIAGMAHIRSITKSLQTFSRIEHDEVELVQLNDVVEATYKMVTNEIRHRAQFVAQLGELPLIAADRGKVSQALLNLLTNAAHAIDGGAADQNTITVTTSVDGEDIVLSVQDSGEGIPEEQLPRIFEPFFTSKPRDRGTGLGLALAAEVIRMHRGDITVTSQVGAGSRFQIRLPLQTGLTVTVDPLDEYAEPLSKKRARVLLIDDEPAICGAFQLLLEQQHDVVVAEGGLAALATLEADTDFDVIICDLMMPKVDGTQVYEKLTSEAPQLLDRIVFCTGGAFTPKAKRFTTNIPNIVLQKPVDPRTLLGVVARVAATPAGASAPAAGEG